MIIIVKINIKLAVGNFQLTNLDKLNRHKRSVQSASEYNFFTQTQVLELLPITFTLIHAYYPY